MIRILDAQDRRFDATVIALIKSDGQHAFSRADFVLPQKSLAGLPVTFADGPSITNFGDAISIRLEAQPTDPNIIDAKIYACDFEQGAMIHHGPA